MASELKPCQIADVLEKCDWAGASIGNKAIVSLAIEALRNTRPAPAATDTGLVTVKPLWGTEQAQISLPNDEYVTRSQAEAIIAAERRNTAEAIREGLKAVGELKADNARLRDSSAPMACDPDEWTATEEVLAHLLINVVGVPDDVTYTPDDAQGIIEKSIKDLKADNAALTARVKELDEQLNAALALATNPTHALKALEIQLAAERKRADANFDKAIEQGKRVKELEISRAEILKKQDKGWRSVQTKARLNKQRAEVLETKLAAARKALKPFALRADRYNDIPGLITTSDDVELWQLAKNKGLEVDITVGDLRHARAALEAKP